MDPACSYERLVSQPKGLPGRLIHLPGCFLDSFLRKGLRYSEIFENHHDSPH